MANPNAMDSPSPLPLLTGSVSVLLGTMVLVGWASHSTALTNLNTQWVAMKANTAVAFVLTGFGWIALGLPRTAFLARFVRISALFVGTLAALTLSQYLIGGDLGLDQLLFKEPVGAVGTSHPGRMAPDTALSFMLLAVAQDMAHQRRWHPWRFFTAITIGALLIAIALAAILCYFSKTLGALGFWGLTLMAAHTAALFALHGLTAMSFHWKRDPDPVIRRTGLSLGLWTLILAGSLAWNLHQEGRAVLRNAIDTARANIEKDIAFRKWATSHGGVYVPPTPRTPPNPYLHLPDRDIMTSTGQALTLMNPAYMLRQLQEDQRGSGELGRFLISLNPLNPDNAPDAWQAQGLRRFERGEGEVMAVHHTGKAPTLRLMRPFLVEEGCLKCHGHQGYRVGDVRGGISSHISMGPALGASWSLSTGIALVTGGIWVVGLLGLGLAYRRERDMDEARKRSESARLHLENQLRRAQRMESLGSLAGGVAHDMNNVLGAILGMASAQLETVPPGSLTHQAFQTIEKASIRGGKMVRSLLDFARQDLAEPRDLDLNTVVREEIKLLEHTTLSRVHLVVELAEDLKPIQGDPGSLSHALMNLCVNAVDAMEEQGTLTLRSRNLAEGWVEIQVEDSGTGMPEEVLEKAMDPYFTTKPQGKGTGLGLSMVYGTMKAHKGKVEIFSQPGKGTCISLRFPASNPGVAEPSPDPSHRESEATGMRVLLVDDDDLMLEAGFTVLTALGHRVTKATSGEAALELLRRGPRPDVVVLDVNMPGMGGQECLGHIRKGDPNLPVVLATGKADQTALTLATQYAGVTLLPKPFTVRDLRAVLQTLAPAGRPSL